jgi:hypothetical protein
MYSGLHLCYLQSHSTIDSMSVVVSNTSPSLLPYIKIRENPHVTAEEWLWLRRMAASDVGSQSAGGVGSQGSAGGVGNQPPRGQQVFPLLKLGRAFSFCPKSTVSH